MRKVFVLFVCLLLAPVALAETFVCKNDNYVVKTFPWNSSSDQIMVLTNNLTNEVSKVTYDKTVVEDMIELIYIGLPTFGSVKYLVLNIDSNTLDINGTEMTVQCVRGDQPVF